MRVLAIADLLINAAMMEKGFKELRDRGHEVVIREWLHQDVKTLQHDNLIVEQQSANAIALPDDLVRDIADFEMVVVQFAPMGRAVLSRAGKLKYVGVLRAGTENVDAAAAKEHGIEIIPTPGRNARAVAEFTVGMILSEMRNIARSHAALKQAVFRKDFPNADAIPELGGKTIGLIGYGNIGSLVARFLSAFDCRILVYDPYLKDRPSEVEMADSLEVLLAESDVVSMHMRLSDESKDMISLPQFKMMKRSAYFINTARSGLVKQDDLVTALSGKLIAGASIDVFDREPIPAGDPILALDNITITPHLAGSTIDAFSNTPRLFTERFVKSHLS